MVDTNDAPRLLKALRGERQVRPPVWLMRQAGRHLQEYRELRSRNRSFMDFCYAPADAAEATLQPLRRYPLDAAILFSDILVVPDALGRKVWFVEGEGPRLEPMSTLDEVKALDMDRVVPFLAPVYETVERVRGSLNPDQTMLGFSGAPWTLATYMIQGKGGDREHARAFGYQNPAILTALLDVLADAVVLHLDAQLKAGAHAVQLFESWAEDLPEAAFAEWVIRPARRVVEGLRALHPDVAIIGFPRGASHRVGWYRRETGVSAVGLDIGADLDAARAAVGPQTCLQGNLDPIVLAAGGPALDAACDRILEAAETGPHVFNLGHGVVPWTPTDHVLRLTRRVAGL